MNQQLSEYEHERLRNIDRNRSELARLGVKDAKPKNSAPRATKGRAVTPKTSSKRPRSPQRRSTRTAGRTAPSYASEQENSPNADSDSAADDSYSSDDEDDEQRPIKRPVAIKPPRPVKKRSDAAGDSKANLLTIESAKTGRSKCRKCRELLEKDETRVGMHAWIMGRQALTWQHPPCFASNVSIALEVTGRSKCQATSELFSKGDIKVGFKSHSATKWVQLSMAWLHLAPVVDLLKTFDVSTLSGFDELDPLQQDQVKSQLSGNMEGTPARAAKPEPELEATPSQAVALKEEEAPEQPAKGSVSRAKGKVCWRFAGHLCYGSLLPAQESKTHCYARTHKGNTKTLTKGGASWWMEN